jgi:hypothetical protein
MRSESTSLDPIIDVWALALALISTSLQNTLPTSTSWVDLYSDEENLGNLAGNKKEDTDTLFTSFS